MIRTLLNGVSWCVMSGGALVALGLLAMRFSQGGSFRGMLQDATLAAVVALVTIAAGGVLQLLVSIDERLELLNERR